MRPANASEYERDSMDCQDADTPVHSGRRDPRTPMKGQARNPAGDEDGWQTVLTLRQKKALAQGKKLKANVIENEGNASQPQLSQATPTARRKPFSRKLPPLPKEDFKVVIRPHQGLPLKNFTSPQLAEAVITACRGQVSGDKFLLRLKPGSNIFIVSTPDQATADHIRRITELRVHGRTHAVNAYVATGEGTGKGVIHGLTPHTPAETLRANLRFRTQGVEILRARMLGDTKTAVITFYGPTVPRYVYYMGEKQRTHSLLHVVEAASTRYFWISPIALFDDWNHPSTHYNQPPTTAHGSFFAERAFPDQGGRNANPNDELVLLAPTRR
ncbi:hypothetical protein MTO96_034148 [Rhipicephalus appendiculatus]